MKKIRYFFESILLGLFFGLMWLLPLKIASSFGGFIGRFIGPKMASSRKARRHIRAAFPDISFNEEIHILRGMWDNLGRVMAEYPHLPQLSHNHVTFQYMNGADENCLRNSNAILFSGHLGNWEVPPPALDVFSQTPVHLMYRAPNNPFVDRMITYFRTRKNNINVHTKSALGGKQVMQAIKDGAALAILVDQKYNEGLNVPFFGHDAMTNPFFIKLARKYKRPLIPAFQRRISKTDFEICVYPPIVTQGRSDEDVLIECHKLLEDFIQTYPEQWLWLHRRWKDI